MKKILIPRIFLLGALAMLLLTACGGGDEATKNKESGALKMFETSEFSVQYPDGWETMLPRDFASEVPAGTLVAFKSQIKDDVFMPNISVLKNELPAQASSLDYAKGLLQDHENRLQNFKELGRKEADIKAGDREFPSLFTEFEGKEREDAEVKEFLQISVVRGKEAYIVTGAYRKQQSADLKNTLEKALKSFALK